MKKNIFRIGSIVLAIVLGIALILLATFAGSASRGPLEDVFVKIGAYITTIDSKLMKRSKGRAKKLKWFEPIRKNPDSLRNPGQVLLGAYDNNTRETYEPIIELEEAIDTVFPIIHIYTAWGDNPDQRFPLSRVKAIHELGSVPLISWEPWLTDFQADEHPELRPRDIRDKGGLKDIASGVYDFYLEKWVDDYLLFDKPVMLRFGHEMNDPYRYPWGPQNNAPEDFVQAWKYVVDFFREKGADQVIWVWSPHSAYGSFETYYPGDEYVDWVGVGTLNYGTVANWSQWYSFHKIFGNHYDQLTTFNKPIMATEFGSLAVGGNRTIWYQSALCDLPEHYPQLKSVLFFHFNKDNTITYKTLDWSFVRDSAITRTIQRCVKDWQAE